MKNLPDNSSSPPVRYDTQVGQASLKTFEIFSIATVRQESAYRSLNKQVKGLNNELQTTNLKLQNKVAELDIITDYLKSILNNVAQGILFIDLNGIVTTYNKIAETILAIPHQQVLFRPFWENFQDDVFGFSMHEILQNKHKHTTFCTTYASPHHYHSEIEVITTFILKDASPGPETSIPSSTPTQGMIVMIKDITEMRRLQNLANRTDRMKELGKMASHVAHEIRNPLGGIKGFAELLKRDLADNPPLQQMASYIVEGTDNLNYLVNQILHYSRPVQPHLENVDLIFLLNETKQHILADTTLNQHPITIAIESAFPELFLALDLSLFKSALLNLLVNAVQAMPNGGDITIAVQKKYNHVILSITDTGTGITEENLNKLYSPFFTTKPDGNGLGLPDVQKVVQAHDGTIDVYSVVGQGTTFVITLPLGSLQK